MPASSPFPNSRIVLLWLVAFSAVLPAQSIYHVESEKTITVDAPGALDAFSLDASSADARAGDGTVTITGRIPGTTHVVVVLLSGTLTWEVVVGKHPLRSPNSAMEGLTSGNAGGYYESLYNSTPSEVQSQVDMFRRDGDLSIHARVVGTGVLGGDFPGASRTELSSAYYQISTPTLAVTLLDQPLDESPLTTAGSIVRGLHFSDDGWFLHAGFTSITAFEGLFLPTQPERMIEGGYRHSLGKHSSLTGSYYYFGVPASSSMGRSGSVGRLSYAYTPSKNFKLNVDLGLSRGVGAASRLEYSSDRDTLRGSIQYAPPAFASLSATNLRGLRSDFRWARRIGSRFDNTLTFYSNDLVLPGIRQSTVTAGSQLQYRLTKRWSLFGGATGSTFRILTPASPAVLNLSAPAGLRFHQGSFSVDGQYEFTRASEQDTGGRQFRGSARAGHGSFSVSVFGQEQKQTPSLSFVLGNATGLQQILDQLGLEATSIQQVDQLLSEIAYLFAGGYIQGANINLVPRRDQAGGTIDWAQNGRSRTRLSYNFLYNNDHGLTTNSVSTSQSLVFTQRFGSEDFGLSFSILDTQSPGLPRQRQEVGSISWKHRVESVPALLIPERHGVIEGVAFRDDSEKGTLDAGTPPIAGATVTLDGKRRTESGADGSYRFAKVPAGKHKLVVSFESDLPIFFSTPAQVEADENATVNFGIAYSTAGVLGRIVNDAGQGLADVRVVIRSHDRQWSTASDGAGAFFVRQVPEGTYEVLLQEDSVPPGHLTTDLSSQQVQVGVSIPGSATFTVRALRSIAGRVLRFDAASGRNVPAPSERVTLEGTGQTSTTDALGRYLFRDLPAGSYTVSVMAPPREVARLVMLPAAPTTLSNVDLQIGEASPAAAPLPPASPVVGLLGPATSAPPVPAPSSLEPRPTVRSVSPGSRPSSAAAQRHERLGRQLLKARRFQDAIVELDQAVGMAPESPTGYNARGFAWFMLGAFKRAVEDLDNAIRLDPDYANAYHNRAAVRKAAGDLSGARADLQREAAASAVPRKSAR